MDNIKGLNISKLGFKPLKLGDFLYHEGPLVAHFVDADNVHEQYLYKWCDIDAQCNRWLIAKCSDTFLVDFFNKKITLRDIINNNAFVYLLDLDNDLNEHNILVVNTPDLPESYLPTAKSFFNEKQYEKYALQLKESIENVENVGNIKQVLAEITTLKEQQRETNSMLNTILKKVFSSPVGYVAEDEVEYGKFQDAGVEVERSIEEEIIYEQLKAFKKTLY